LDATIIVRAMADAGIPEPIPEHRFHPTRRWRFDFAWPAVYVALEIEGGVWTRGRHTRPAGFLRDLEKYNTATSLGWSILRCTPQTVCSEQTISWLTMLMLDCDVIEHDESLKHGGGALRHGCSWREIIRRMPV
jgi:hypothetical protein